MTHSVQYKHANLFLVAQPIEMTSGNSSLGREVSSDGKELEAIVAHEASLPGRNLAIVIALISLVALCISGYLGWVALNSSKVAGCGGGSIFDCNDVINSRWSRWLGVPVSFLAFGMYAAVLASVTIGSSQANQRVRSIAWSLVVVMGLSAGLAAIWFISLQFFILKHLCTYCLAAHTCGLIISGLLLWQRPLGGNAVKYLSIASLLGLGVLIGGQLLFKPLTYKVIEFETPAGQPVESETFEFSVPVDEPATDATTSGVENDSYAFPGLQPSLFSWLSPTQLMQSQLSLLTFQDQAAQDSAAGKQAATNQSTTGQAQSKSTPQTQTPTSSPKPKERRFVTMYGGTLKLDVAQWPLAGEQDAKYIFVEMYDYTCDHCRRTHAAIVGAKAALNGELAILALPIPLNTNCNNAITVTGPRMVESCEISKLAVAVWRVDPSKFEEFHHYLMTTPNIVTYAEASAKAKLLVDSEKLKAVLASNVPSQYIAQHVELYKKVGTGNVPKMLFPATSIVGEFTSAAGLVEVIKQQIK